MLITILSACFPGEESMIPLLIINLINHINFLACVLSCVFPCIFSCVILMLIGHVDVVRFLLEYSASVDDVDKVSSCLPTI